MRTFVLPWHSMSMTALGIFSVAFLATPHLSGQNTDGYAIVGTQGLGKPIFARLSAQTPRINVLELDVWRHSLEDGSLVPVANVPFATHQLIRQDYFSPDFYQRQIQRLGNTYSRQPDVLMYFGALPVATSRHGLNFNGWSVEDLRQLRNAGRRPFIGLESTDPGIIEWMGSRLHEAGYGPLNRIYVRICSEPSEMSYGSEDGTTRGKRHTPAAFAAYKHRFAAVANQLHRMNSQYGLDLYVVFAGTNAEDFHAYIPDDELYDALGYDLYVTPENKEKSMRQIQDLKNRMPWKPIVIPEFGIATTGPDANPSWAQETLGEISMTLAQHPAGVSGVTVFSVNVAGRLPPRRWSWAWTPMMFEMLKEWQLSPRQWRKDGFHRYDPLSYPVGRDVLYVDLPDLRIVYRRLATSKISTTPYFYEVRFIRDQDRWTHRSRIFAFK